MIRTKLRTVAGGSGRVAAVLLVPLIAAGCGDVVDDLLEVEVPALLPADALESPGNASLLVSSAIGDFECALARFILIGGSIGNELRDAQQTGGTGMWRMDRRQLTTDGIYATNDCTQTLPGLYVPLSTARWIGDNVLQKLESEWTDAQVPNRTRLIATAAAYTGYSTLLMGEAFCSAAFDAGPELSRAEVFQRAEERFTRAIAAAESADDASILAMARVGRARARLNLGRAAEAAADARLVPEGFVRNAEYSAASVRVENRVFAMINRDNQYTVEEIYRGLEFGGVADARVEVVNTGALGTDRSNVIWAQQKYLSEAAPIPIARWAEAQLIIAEAEGGQTAVDIINDLHARAGLPPFGISDPAAVQAQVEEERRRELFLEGHALYDLTRYASPLYPAPGEPYPFKGGVYGSDVCIPLPQVESDNNPNV